MTIEAAFIRGLSPIKYAICGALLGGCAQNGYVNTQSSDVSGESGEETASYSFVSNAYFGNIATSSSVAEKGRAAILAMQGEHKVNFDFK